jgi:hypothetical protein
MLIRSRMGVSADGYVSTDGVPALAVMPGFEPGVSHGFPEFIQGCDAVVMGRNTGTPGDVVVVRDGLPRSYGGCALAAPARTSAWPAVRGPSGRSPSSVSSTGPAPGQGSQGSTPLRLLRSDRTFTDGSVGLVYEVGRTALT